MRFYLQGMGTGCILTLTFILTFGGQQVSEKKFSKTYRDKLIEIEDRMSMLEGVVIDRFKLVGENFIYLKNKTGVSVNTEYNFNSMVLIDESYPFIIIADK